MRALLRRLLRGLATSSLWYVISPRPISPTMEATKAALRRFAESRGLTIHGWCDRAGIPATTVYSFLEKPGADIGLSRIIALADAEDVSIDEMIGRSLPSKDTP